MSGLLAVMLVNKYFIYCLGKSRLGHKDVKLVPINLAFYVLISGYFLIKPNRTPDITLDSNTKFSNIILVVIQYQLTK